MKMILIGLENSKRTVYFKKAAEQLHIPVSVLEWDMIAEAFQKEQLKGAAVKIDPPSYHTFHLPDMKEKIEVYQRTLQNLEDAGCTFLNSPGAILNVLDKRNCKLRLQMGGVPVTQMLSEPVQNTEQLIALMDRKRVFSVFIKPVFFSGAAGVVAFRMHPGNQKMTAYTSCRLVEGTLVNTKTLYCTEDYKEVCSLLDAVLSLDVIVERWYPKSSFQGKSYDLRVVYQFGHIAHIVVRQSDGPITNLHLNNQALNMKELGLDKKITDELGAVCGKAIDLFPGLSMAGIDILLEKNSQRPFIIEMNGQGDLIYQDIYRDNRIYQEQVLHLAEGYSKKKLE